MKKEALRRFESLPRELSAAMSRCLRAPLRALAIVFGIPALAAWDPAGHRTVAEIAWEYMTLRARERAVALLMHGPAQADFASLRPADGAAAERDRALSVTAATWAHLVRNRRQPWPVCRHPTR